MTCDICGEAAARALRITKTYGKGKDLLVVENVPAVSCRNCAQIYFTAETLHELDRIKGHRLQVAKKRTVAVAEFP